MPHGYEVMRDSFKKKGLSDKAAKKKAAMIWNAKHKGNPVTRAKHESFCDFMESKEDDALHSYDDQIRKVSKHLGQDVHLVGGPVRDALMGRKSKDTDMVTIGGLQKIHDKGWTQKKKDFPVFQHPEHPGVDLALGRGEKKTGTGHTEFDWHEAPDLKTDLSRRDFTVNAMAYHPDKGITDPHGGRQDIEKKTLRHVGPAFADDPLRVMRGARFASQLDFDVAPETVNQFTKANNELKTLSKERVRGEVERAMKEPKPSRFFKTLSQSKSMGHWFPEIEKTIGVPAGPANKHPEGDTFNHSMHAVDYAAGKGHDLKTRTFALTHDLGKAETPKEEWPRHLGHETKTEPGKALMNRLGYGKGEVKDVATHTQTHMLPHHQKLRPGTVVDYFRKVKNIEEPHFNAVTADAQGKGLPDTGEPENVSKLRTAFKAIRNTKIEPDTPVEKIKSKQAQSVSAAMGKHEAFCDFMENRWSKSPQADISSFHSRMKGKNVTPKKYPSNVKSSTDGLGNPIPVKKVPHLSVRKYYKFGEPVQEDNETMGVGMITPESEKRYTAKDKPGSTAKPKKPNYPMDPRGAIAGYDTGGRADEEVGGLMGIPGNESNEQSLAGAATSSKNLKLHQFTVKGHSAPKTLSKLGAELKKFKRDIELRHTGAIFGEDVDESGPGHKHDELYNALANRAATHIKNDNTVGTATGAALSAANKEHADSVIKRETTKNAKKHESFCTFMEAYLDNDTRRSIFNTIKSINTSRAIDMKRRVPPSDIETGVARELRASANKYREGSKPWDAKDRGIEDHFHKLADNRMGLVDKLKVKGK